MRSLSSNKCSIPTENILPWADRPSRCSSCLRCNASLSWKNSQSPNTSALINSERERLESNSKIQDQKKEGKKKLKTGAHSFIL